MIEFGMGRLEGIDLTDPKTHAGRDLREVWRYIRETQPVLWHPTSRGGFWVVSRYDDVRSIYADKEHFTSKNGNALDSLLAGGDPAGGKMLSLSDGPRHREIRSRVLKCLRQLLMSGAGNTIRESVQCRIGKTLDAECDLVEQVAKHIPLDSICGLMGIEEQRHRDLLFSLSSNALSSEDPGMGAEQSLIARNEILMVFAEMIERRRVLPGQDLVNDLVNLPDDDFDISDEEILYNCYSLLLGGNEEPRFAIAGMLKALAGNPGEWMRLKTRQVRISDAVEEFLRWTTPVLHLARTVVTDTIVGNTTLRAGEIVSLWNVSANFDDEIFKDPYRLNLDRRENAHLSLGFGNHFCLGASLARLELSAVLEVLVDRVDKIEVTGPEKPVYSNFVWGLASLPGLLKSRTPGSPGRSPEPYSLPGDVCSGFFNPDTKDLLCIRPKDNKFEPLTWLQSHKGSLDRILARNGAFVLRNFGINSISEFNKVALTFDQSLLEYVNRSTPRTKLGGKIYTATEYPRDRKIFLHNENSYSDVWPSRIFFYSAIVAEKGGETIVADSRNIYTGIDPRIRKKFEEKGLMYVRNYTAGIDLGWQEVFQTDSKKEVDTFCSLHGIDAEWKTGTSALTTRQKGQVTLRHPATGEWVWFNQAHLFHLSALDPPEQDILIRELGPGNVPRNVFYGDGEPIDPDIIRQIREVYDRETITFQWQRGDVMVLDNVLFAHGRNPFSGERKVAVAMA